MFDHRWPKLAQAVNPLEMILRNGVMAKIYAKRPSRILISQLALLTPIKKIRPVRPVLQSTLQAMVRPNPMFPGKKSRAETLTGLRTSED